MPVAIQKTREIQNHHVDSTIWNDFAFRDDDIIIATYAKAGTTWMQQIVSQLVFMGAEDVPVAEISPWVDLRVPPKEVKLPLIEAQAHRRILKTHLPVDALVFSEQAKYLYIGRDGRDVVWSLYNHHVNANDAWYDALNNTPGRVGAPIEPPEGTAPDYFEHWLANDGAPFWSFWENVSSWWAIRDCPNVMMVHFADLKKDMDGQIRRIAGFLDIAVNETVMQNVLEHCTFDYMKTHADRLAPLGGAFWDGGARTFIHKGQNGRWTEELSNEVSARYEQMALDRLGADCAHWLAHGNL